MIESFEGHVPSLGRGVFVAETAAVIGQVTLGDDASVWFSTVLRGDVGSITVGARTNLQDLCAVHVMTDRFDTSIGSDVSVGHHVMLHGCRLHDHVLVGMGAIVLDDVEIEPYAMIAAGSLVPPGMRVPAGHLVVGSPARVRRELTEAERQHIDWTAAHYVELARRHCV